MRMMNIIPDLPRLPGLSYREKIYITIIVNCILTYYLILHLKQRNNLDVF